MFPVGTSGGIGLGWNAVGELNTFKDPGSCLARTFSALARLLDPMRSLDDFSAQI